MLSSELILFSVPTESNSSEVSLRDLLSIIIDVNRGAAYLEMNKHVHRNIAAKNCLISKQSNNLITKLGDFGFARGAYSNDMEVVCGVNSPLLRHLSPETLTDGQFAPKSDVWSFGVSPYSRRHLFSQISGSSLWSPFIGSNSIWQVGESASSWARQERRHTFQATVLSRSNPQNHVGVLEGCCRVSSILLRPPGTVRIFAGEQWIPRRQALPVIFWVLRQRSLWDFSGTF